MPELPEVEITRRHLAPVVTAAPIATAEVRRDRMVRRQPAPADFTARLRGNVVHDVGRVGKFILAAMEDDLVWVTHLGMSGRLQLAGPGDPEAKHTNVVITLKSAVEVRFVDPRTFGFMAVLTPDELSESGISSLGRDALDDLPTPAELARLLQGRSAPLKALLLNQRLLAGLGNIYADEVLHRAGLDPRRPGGSLTAVEVAALRKAVRPVLKAGIGAGGTSLSDLAYLLPDGRAGEYLHRLAVYGRTGEACRRCGGTITRTIVGSRSTHWCAGCQA